MSMQPEKKRRFRIERLEERIAPTAVACSCGGGSHGPKSHGSHGGSHNGSKGGSHGGSKGGSHGGKSHGGKSHC
jgi:hypothetical protein